MVTLRKLHGERTQNGASAHIVAVALVAAASALGCNEKVPQYREDATTASVTASASVAASSSAEAPDELGARRGQGNRSDAPVFVDGELRAVLRYGELPPSFEPTVVDRRGDYRICNVARYLEALGVKLDDVDALHLEGSGRTAAITGDELRRMKDKLHFTFSKLRGTLGKPMADWPSEKVISTTRIDKIAGIHVFVNKPAPTWNATKKAFFWEDGKEVEGVPHLGEFEPIKAPRLYVDGKLFGFVESDETPKELVKTGDGRGTGKTTDIEVEEEHRGKRAGGGRKTGGTGGGQRILLAKYLAHRGVDLGAVTAVEIIGEDRVLGRFDAKAWNAQLDQLTFGIPKRSSKALRLELPETATPYPGPVTAQAIAIYTTSKPPAREITQPKRRPRRN